MRNKSKLLLPLIIAAGFFVWLVWDNYVSRQEAPLLKASLEPKRVKPDVTSDDIEQPHSSIYEKLRNPTVSNRAVQLVPEPEEPITIIPPASKDAIKEDPIGNIISGIIDIPEESKNEVAETQPEKSLNVITMANEPSAQTFKKRNKTAYYLHLLSTSSKELAEKQWRRINKNNPKLVAGLEHKILKSSNKKTGIFYELLAGPVRDHSRAKLLCKKLVQAKQNCIIKQI